MYREVQKICIRKIYTSENAYMYREVRNICITFEIYVSGKYIYQKPHLLYRQECFTGKYTARKIHTKLHPGPEWRIFHILTSEYIDDVISRSFTAVRCKQSVKNGER